MNPNNVLNNDTAHIFCNTGYSDNLQFTFSRANPRSKNPHNINKFIAHFHSPNHETGSNYYMTVYLDVPSIINLVNGFKALLSSPRTGDINFAHLITIACESGDCDRFQVLYNHMDIILKGITYQENLTTEFSVRVDHDTIQSLIGYFEYNVPELYIPNTYTTPPATHTHEAVDSYEATFAKDFEDKPMAAFDVDVPTDEEIEDTKDLLKITRNFLR